MLPPFLFDTSPPTLYLEGTSSVPSSWLQLSICPDFCFLPNLYYSQLAPQVQHVLFQIDCFPFLISYLIMLRNLDTLSTDLASSPLLLFFTFLLIGSDPSSSQPLIVYIMIYMYLCTQLWAHQHLDWLSDSIYFSHLQSCNFNPSSDLQTRVSHAPSTPQNPVNVFFEQVRDMTTKHLVAEALDVLGLSNREFSVITSCNVDSKTDYGDLSLSTDQLRHDVWLSRHLDHLILYRARYQIKVVERVMQYIIKKFDRWARHKKSASLAKPSTSR